MPKWEYVTWGTDDVFGYSGSRVMSINGEDVDDDRSIYEALDEAGLDGWELVSAMRTEFRLVFLFKRLIAER